MRRVQMALPTQPLRSASSGSGLCGCIYSDNGDKKTIEVRSELHTTVDWNSRRSHESRVTDARDRTRRREPSINMLGQTKAAQQPGLMNRIASPINCHANSVTHLGYAVARIPFAP